MKQFKKLLTTILTICILLNCIEWKVINVSADENTGVQLPSLSEVLELANDIENNCVKTGNNSLTSFREFMQNRGYSINSYDVGDRWCAYFVSTLLRLEQTGAASSSCNTLIDNCVNTTSKSFGRFILTSENRNYWSTSNGSLNAYSSYDINPNYIPSVGDLVFYEYNCWNKSEDQNANVNWSYNGPEHVGFVISVNGTKIETLEGSYNDYSYTYNTYNHDPEEYFENFIKGYNKHGESCPHPVARVTDVRDWAIYGYIKPNYSSTRIGNYDSIEYYNKNVSLDVGKKSVPLYYVTKDNNRQVAYNIGKAEFSTSNSSVATVSNDGTITAVNPGVATITVKKINFKGGSVSASANVYVGPIHATSMSLSSFYSSMGINQTKQLTPSFYPSNTTYKDVYWSSSNPNVASVDSNGLVTARSAGYARITATSKTDNVSASCYIDVKESYPTYLFLSPLFHNVAIGNTFKYSTPFMMPFNASDKTLYWSSSDPSIAEVDNNGFVKTHRIGTVTISVSSKSHAIARSTLTVTLPEIQSISLNKTNIALYKNGKEKLDVTKSPVNSAYSTYTWRSLAPWIATVDSFGNVTGKAPGSTIIVVSTSNGKTASCLVTVRAEEKPITTIILSPSFKFARMGEYFKINKITFPLGASGDITWSSSNPYVATVDNYGNVHVKGRGRAIIYARSKFAQGSCTIISN